MKTITQIALKENKQYYQVLIENINNPTLKLFIYHCLEDTPVAAMDFGIGFPNLPFYCPVCGILIQEDLNMDLGIED